MERLTEKERNFNGTGRSKRPLIEERKGLTFLTEHTNKVMTKLADYEDAEEAGLLIHLPCKAVFDMTGGVVWYIYDGEIIECVHCGASLDGVDGNVWVALACDEKIFPYREPIPEYDTDPTDWYTKAIDVLASEFGKTVFVTREEAEKALEAMEK